ncbi:MAG TPA: DUF3806 domain-containing protein [Rhizomicrobium sp.]|nr:DUF3806 domain-containing protein [Rhizomicrobium sp.]
MEQKVGPFEDKDKSELEERRAWVYGANASASDFASVEAKLDLLAAMLDSGVIKPSHEWQLKSLGVVFGDILAQSMDLIWVMVDDEYGRSPALMVPQTTILLFPVTALLKRLEDGETVDIHELYGGFYERVTVLKEQGAKPQ